MTRPALAIDEIDRLTSQWATQATVESWPATVHEVARISLRYEGSCRQMFDWLEAIAERSGSQQLLDDARGMRRFYLTVGPAREPEPIVVRASTLGNVLAD